MGLTKRSGSEVFWYEEAVPRSIVARLMGKRCRFTFLDDPSITIDAKFGTKLRTSLRTEVRDVAEVRARDLGAHLAWRYRQAEAGPVALTHRDRVALSKSIYDLIVRLHADEPGSMELWAAVKATSRAAFEGRRIEVPALDPHDPKASIAPALRGVEDLTRVVNDAPIDPAFGEAALMERYGGMVEHVLAEQAILDITEADRLALLREFHRASTDGMWRLKRHADGDYSPDPKEARFPPIAKALPPRATSSPALSLRAMYRKWEAQHESEGLSSATRARVKPIIEGFIRFVGHEDAMKFTEADVERWKDHRLRVDGVSPKTVASVDLAFLRTVLNESVDGHRVRPNPAQDVRLKVRKKSKERPEGFSKEEAERILRASLRASEATGRLPQKAVNARRWIPWLCAYTGSRVGEIAQLRKEDVTTVEGIPCLAITPDAGSVKDGEYRAVPLHPHLIDQGFLEFVAIQAAGPLFYEPTKRTAERPWDRTSKHIVEWVRSDAVGVTDMRVQPTHGWRHRFKTVAEEAGVDPRYVDAICGHSPASVGAGYGARTPKTLHREISKLPRYEV